MPVTVSEHSSARLQFLLYRFCQNFLTNTGRLLSFFDLLGGLVLKNEQKTDLNRYVKDVKGSPSHVLFRQ